MDRKEKDDLLLAADQLIHALNQAILDVESSGNWNVYSVFGGGLSSKIFRSRKEKNAMNHIDLARSAVKDFADLVEEMGICTDDPFVIDSTYAEKFLLRAAEEWISTDHLRDADEELRDAVDRVRTFRELLRRGEIQ